MSLGRENSQNRVTLLLTGLYPRHPTPDPKDFPRLPALQRLASRASRSALQNVSTLEAAAFALFSAVAEDDGDLPIAAVTRVLDLAVIDKGWWLRADPVHLSPQRDRLMLTDASALDITQDEATRLCAEIGELYKSDGWLLKAPRPGRWYLKPARAPKLNTTPLADVVGRDIHPYLPTGRDGKAWHTILNEIQILLHGSKVNEEREKHGKPPINSLWFWGGGRVPVLGESDIAHVWSDEAVSLALARLGDTASHAAPPSFSSWLAENPPSAHHLIVLDHGREVARGGDIERWAEHLADLERDWFAPVFQALHSRALASVRLVTDSGQLFEIDSARARRWWQWPKSMWQFRG